MTIINQPTKCIPPHAVAEFKAKAEFKKLDRNQDEALSFQEFAFDGTHPWTAMMKKVDLAEIKAKRAEFDKYDTNGDGKLSRDEFVKGRTGKPSISIPVRPEGPFKPFKPAESESPSFFDRLKDLLPIALPVVGPFIGLKKLADKFFG